MTTIKTLKIQFTSVTGLTANVDNARHIANNMIDKSLNGRHKAFWEQAVSFATDTNNQVDDTDIAKFEAKDCIEVETVELVDTVEPIDTQPKQPVVKDNAYYLARAKEAKAKQIESDSQLRKTLLTPVITNHPTATIDRSERVRQIATANTTRRYRLDPVKAVYAVNAPLHSIGKAYSGTKQETVVPVSDTTKKLIKAQNKALKADKVLPSKKRPIIKSIPTNYKARIQKPVLATTVSTSGAYRLKASHKNLRDIFALYS